MRIVLFANLVMMAATAYAADNQASGWRPTPAEAAAIGSICQGWRDRGVGVLLLRQQDAPKPAPRNEIDAKLIDEIYKYPVSQLNAKNIDFRGMAGSDAEQFCMAAMKEKFRTGQMRLSQ